MASFYSANISVTLFVSTGLSVKALVTFDDLHVRIFIYHHKVTGLYHQRRLFASREMMISNGLFYHFVFWTYEYMRLLCRKCCVQAKTGFL
jgi:hypothetical protein